MKIPTKTMRRKRKPLAACALFRDVSDPNPSEDQDYEVEKIEQEGAAPILCDHPNPNPNPNPNPDPDPNLNLIVQKRQVAGKLEYRVKWKGLF